MLLDSFIKYLMPLEFIECEKIDNVINFNRRLHVNYILNHFEKYFKILFFDKKIIIKIWKLKVYL